MSVTTHTRTLVGFDAQGNQVFKKKYSSALADVIAPCKAQDFLNLWDEAVGVVVMAEAGRVCFQVGQCPGDAVMDVRIGQDFTVRGRRYTRYSYSGTFSAYTEGSHGISSEIAVFKKGGGYRFVAVKPTDRVTVHAK